MGTSGTGRSSPITPGYSARAPIAGASTRRWSATSSERWEEEWAVADLRRMRRRSRTIEILHDPQDDVRVLHAIRRRCGAGSRRLLVVPDPSGQDRDLRRDLLRAFGELPSGWRASGWTPRQLALFPSGSWTREAEHP